MQEKYTNSNGKTLEIGIITYQCSFHGNLSDKNYT